MTKHDFEVGKAYRTQCGKKAWFVANGRGLGYPIFEYREPDDNSVFSNVGFFHESKIIGQWEEPSKEIDVANMWVAVTERAGHIIAHRKVYRDKPESSLPANTIAIIRVSEWEAIKRGERKLIRGEGL